MKKSTQLQFPDRNNEQMDNVNNFYCRVFNKVKSRSAHMKSHRPIPSPDTVGQESKKSNNHHQHKQSHNQDQSNSSSLLSHGHDYRQKISTSDTVNPSANNIWHNPTRLRPP